ncbi:MAG: protein phosphatase 2C domain-containing protein [Kofleriaceae bacterium]
MSTGQIPAVKEPPASAGGDGEATAADAAPPIEAVVVTDVGVVRDYNEDSAHVDGQHAFYIVADGMGGHAAGEVASAMAVDTVRKKLDGHRGAIRAFGRAPSEQGRRDLVNLLQGSVLAAHQAVFQRGTDESDKHGMGTTLDVVLVAGAEAFVAHVGDSRTYLVRDGRTSQVTTDHTVAEVLVIEGKLSIEEAQTSPLRTVLVNAVGVSKDVGVEMAHLQLRAGDRLLLCSDGLHDYFLEEEEIAAKLSGTPIGPALQEMVDLAKERGGHDNITGIVVAFNEVPDAVPTAVERDATQPVNPADADAEADSWEADRTESAPSTGTSTRDAAIAAIRPKPDGDAAPVTVQSPLVGIKLPEAIQRAATQERRRVVGAADTLPPRQAEAMGSEDTIEGPALPEPTPADADDDAPVSPDAPPPAPRGRSDRPRRSK